MLTAEKLTKKKGKLEDVTPASIGATMTMGRGAIQSISRKQKLNTRSSTEAELVAVDDMSVMILWTKLFVCGI